MFKYLVISLIIILYQPNTISAHELPHQQNTEDYSCRMNNNATSHTFNEAQIVQWFELELDNGEPLPGDETNASSTSETVYNDAKDEKTQNEYLNDLSDVLGTIAMGSDFEGMVSSQSNIVCTIYVKPYDVIGPLCGEVDHFMKAAQGAINYCQMNGGREPNFIAPQNFLDALTENTLGAHHDNYHIEEGIVFSCVKKCPKNITFKH